MFLYWLLTIIYSIQSELECNVDLFRACATQLTNKRCQSVKYLEKKQTKLSQVLANIITNAICTSEHLSFGFFCQAVIYRSHIQYKVVSSKCHEKGVFKFSLVLKCGSIIRIVIVHIFQSQ